MTTFHEILGAASALSAPERVELIRALWSSVAVEDWPAPSSEWVAEAQRRSQEIDTGSMATTSWTEARANARRRAGLDG